MTMLVQQDVRGLQITVDDIPTVHVLEAEDHFRGVKLYFRLVKNSVLI